MPTDKTSPVKSPQDMPDLSRIDTSKPIVVLDMDETMLSALQNSDNKYN